MAFPQAINGTLDTLRHVDIGLLLAGLSSTALIVLWVTIGRNRNKANGEMAEPPMLPGYVPVLGHALLWFKDSSQVHQKAR